MNGLPYIWQHKCQRSSLKKWLNSEWLDFLKNMIRLKMFQRYEKIAQLLHECKHLKLVVFKVVL